MNRLSVLLVCVLLGCAQDGDDGADGEDGESVELVEFGSSAACPAGGVRLTVGKTSKEVCDGERGAAGAMGERGAPGAAGAAGAQGGVALVAQTITACHSLVTLPSGASAALSYKLVTFSDGLAFVSCSAQTSGTGSFGQTEIYAGWQQGAAAGACIVASDGSGAADGGWWEFTTVSGRPRVVYNDKATADHLASFAFPPADCPTSTRPN